MAQSKIDICNVALNLIGEDRIRSFDEDNKNARLCDRLFDSSRDLLLSIFDWPFARATWRMKEILDESEHTPEGIKIFKLPDDILRPWDVYPVGTNVRWEIYGNTVHVPESFCDDSGTLLIYYTRLETNPKLYSSTFANSLSELLASRLAMPITGDKKIAERWYNIHQLTLNTAMAVEANIGSDYRREDDNPMNDPFVNPDKNYNTGTYNYFDPRSE